MTTWGTLIAASLGCYGLKLAGVSLPASVLNHPRVQRTADLLPVAMLTALVVTDLFDAGGRYHADWGTLAGVGAGAVALWRGRSLIFVFLLAIATTALLRLAAWPSS
jgi:branched-subunit amino acid transport protein